MKLAEHIDAGLAIRLLVDCLEATFNQAAIPIVSEE